IAGDASPAQSLRVPASLAYAEPDPKAMEISERDGVTGWSAARERVAWYGKHRSTGTLNVSLAVRLPVGEGSRLRLAVARHAPGVRATEQWLIARVQGQGRSVVVDFGSVTIASPGYYRLSVQGLAKTGATFGDLDALVLAGPAARGAGFNRPPEQRGAPSVHL